MKSKQLTKLSLLTSTLLLGASFTIAHADDTVTANVALASDYVWRGVSQTDENPALSGGFDWSPSDDFYVGTWASNVDFGSVENIELDIYGGYATEFDNGVSLDLGFIQYLYFNNDNDVDFNEIYAGLGWNGLSGKISYDTRNQNTYFEAGYDYQLTSNIGLALHVGNYSFLDGDDYTDWSIGLNGSFAGVDLGLTYTDTDDIDNLDIADARVVFSIGKSF